jgi:cellulose synthase/poly-beta-1,6-N-acetylglucosamine synthase-like glycosyltransferase
LRGSAARLTAVLPAELLFWLSAAIPFYAYLGYPLVLVLMGAVFKRPVRKQEYEPSVTLLIPAYNEAGHIAGKIRDSLALEYPAEKLEILVACDGSRDQTPAIAQSLADGVRVRVLNFPKNRGKILTLNDGVRESHGEIVVFSDATALLYPDSLRWLMMSFADPQVGAVSGRYTVIRADEVGIGKSEDFYWKYETYLKVLESQLDSMLGAHGHLHAIRRDLYPYPPPGTINDDYIIPVSVLAKGYRAVYEPKAVVYEEAREMTGFGRRVRIMAGNLQQLREIRGLLRPLRVLPLFFFLSHKVSRLVVPFAMVAALTANALLLSSPFYRALFCLQAIFYLLALAGMVIRLRPKSLMLPYYFCMINTAVFFGVYHAMTSRRSMTWE